MRPTDIARSLIALRPTQEPLMIAGPPGVGKSSLYQQAAAALDCKYMDVRLYLREVTDFNFPLVDLAKRKVEWIQSILPTDPEWEGIIVLEELPQALPIVQNVASNLLLDRSIGDYRLPEKAWVVACGNRQQDRSASHRIPKHVASRLLHLTLEVSHDDWMAWAINNGIHPAVRSFLAYRPNLLHQFDPASGEDCFPCPRSWAKTSKILPHTPEDLLHPLVSGYVTDGPAAEFVAFNRIYRDLPDVDALLANPLAGKVPSDPAVLYAMTGAITERARKADGKVLENVGTLAGRLPDEFCVLLMRDVQQVNNSFKGTRMAAQLLRKHRDVFLANIK